MPLVPTTWFDDDDEELTEIETSDEEEDEEPTPPPVCKIRPPVVKPVPQPVSVSAAASKSTRVSTQKATQKSKERCGTRPAIPVLPLSRSSGYSVEHLHTLIDQGLVDLNPEYQRGVVWNDKKQSDLINSLFSNYYVPPVVFTVIQEDDGSQKRICIDGKQRLTSIHRFFLGEIPYKDSTTNRKSYYKNPPGVRRKLLLPALCTNFKNQQIVCVEYANLTPQQEREIFQRVQLGVALAPADRLPAINGPYADLVRGLRRRIQTTHGFECYLDWGKARGKDFQALAQIVYLIAHGHQPTKAEPTSTRLEAFLSNDATERGLNNLQDDATNTMGIYCRIAAHATLGQPLVDKLSPIEFVMASYLVFLHRKKLSDMQLSDSMSYMRKDFKRTCPDKKYTTKNFKHILTFVQREVPKLLPKLKRLKEGHLPAYNVPFIASSGTESGFMQQSETKMDYAPVARASEPKLKAVPKKEKITKRKREETDDEYGSDAGYVIPKKAKKEKKDTGNAKDADKPKPKSMLAAPASRSAKTVVKRSASSQAKVSAAALAEPLMQEKTSTASAQPSGSNAKASTSAAAVRSPVSAAASASSAGTAVPKNPTLQPQVGRPSVRPQASARIASTSAPVTSNTVNKSTTPVAQNPPPPETSLTPSTSRAPLPGRLQRSPSAVPPQTAMNIVQEVSRTTLLPSATSFSVPAAKISHTDSLLTPSSLSPLNSSSDPCGEGGGPATTAMTTSKPSFLNTKELIVSSDVVTTDATGMSRQAAGVQLSTSSASGGVGSGGRQRPPLPKIKKYNRDDSKYISSAPSNNQVVDDNANSSSGSGSVAESSRSGTGNGKEPPTGPRSFMEGRTLASRLKASPNEIMPVSAKSRAKTQTPTASSSNTPAGSPTIPGHVLGQKQQRQPTRDPRLAARETASTHSSEDTSDSLFSPTTSAASSPVLQQRRQSTVPDLQVVPMGTGIESLKRARADQDEGARKNPPWSSKRDGFNR